MKLKNRKRGSLSWKRKQVEQEAKRFVFDSLCFLSTGLIQNVLHTVDRLLKNGALTRLCHGWKVKD